MGGVNAKRARGTDLEMYCTASSYALHSLASEASSLLLLSFARCASALLASFFALLFARTRAFFWLSASGLLPFFFFGEGV